MSTLWLFCMASSMSSLGPEDILFSVHQSPLLGREAGERSTVYYLGISTVEQCNRLCLTDRRSIITTLPPLLKVSLRFHVRLSCTSKSLVLRYQY
ncbi:hypothetical protein BKA65DRAFT_499713 [Rhexocercosporidium sp. MPI-PUGE-AT-0058]|nr:hypothetical protein BKA65DRAFT_499713 [Rhexocercosporidium sp. MPI-PUGE-AT-0058]